MNLKKLCKLVTYASSLHKQEFVYDAALKAPRSKFVWIPFFWNIIPEARIKEN